MKTNLTTILVTMLMFSGIAAADRPPAGPDFQHRHPSRATDHAYVASQGKSGIDPSGVISFRLDSATLDVADRVELGEAAKWLAAHPGYRLVIEGHADAIGPAPYNVGLSARRARAVRDALVEAGVPRERVVVAIYGQAKPLSHNPIGPANRVAVLYATKLMTSEIVELSLSDPRRGAAAVEI